MGSTGVDIASRISPRGWWDDDGEARGRRPSSTDDHIIQAGEQRVNGLETSSPSRLFPGDCDRRRTRPSIPGK
jgi:hypothetical protein